MRYFTFYLKINFYKVGVMNFSFKCKTVISIKVREVLLGPMVVLCLDQKSESPTSVIRFTNNTHNILILKKYNVYLNFRFIGVACVFPGNSEPRCFLHIVTSRK